MLKAILRVIMISWGKESVCLDLKARTDKAIFSETLSTADVFIQNLAPGAVDRLGFAPNWLRAEHTALITISISGYGDERPYDERKAYDLLLQLKAGCQRLQETTL